MTTKLIKLTLAVAAAAIVLGSALTTNAYPPFLKKSGKIRRERLPVLPQTSRRRRRLERTRQLADRRKR